MNSAVFDPFGDFATRGYLRNVRQDKDSSIIKQFEHVLFRANLDAALAHLASREELTYQDFLTVHRILFADYYPWAGQDRATTMPHGAVKKGEVLFSHPQSARLAVEHGLRLGRAAMQGKPGEVMGLFAYGHPFLDGNGRTMLLVHLELCHRAGFSLAWQHTQKTAYLEALSREIATPGKGILDAYLLQFKSAQQERGTWGADILLMKGLDGLGEANQVAGDLSDPAIAEKYRKFEEKRGYAYTILQSVR
jgi:cell filamentation protein